MKSLRTLMWVGVAGAILSTTTLAQLCSIPCNGTQIVCQHQNGIRNHRGGPATALSGPNGATGNVLGDAEWKIWGTENGMTRGSGLSTFTNWEIGASSPGPGTQSFDIPDLELRPVVLVGGVKEPDMTAVAIDTELVGNIALPTGGFRINVTILGPTVAAPASCVGNAGLPVLSNSDVAMLFLLTPGEVTTQTNYYLNFRLNTEINTISNPSSPTTGVGNSYSGTVDGLLGAVTHYAINQELYGEMGFFDPTLESYRLTTGFTAPTRGAGARELASGDSFFLRSEDWQAGASAMLGPPGQDRLAAVVLSDNTAGSPLGLAPPGNPPGFLAGSLFLAGSTGVLGLYPTGTTIAFLTFSATIGAGLNCHIVGDVACAASGVPSVFTDMQATTATLGPIPPGLTGAVFYAAAFYINLSTFTLDDGSNTVELLFI
ncbi:MAG TPA: hypothetical protein VFI25_03565 [Planctomycetota bacterium]|jgi:hypothetical protein|nr:hypothetical protein [Planctomycetota bacterium]